MKISLEESFVRDCRKLSLQQSGAVFEVILRLRSTLANAGSHEGAGLRKLHPTGLWEVRVGLSLRAIFRMSKNEVLFTMVGSHDDVNRYLRSL